MNYRVIPPDGFVEACVAVPLSKSMSNRALIINALTAGSTPLTAVAECDDTRAITDALAAGNGTVNIGAAGTAMRFLTAYYAATEGSDVVLDGSERMRRRPVGPLVDALKALGADIEYTADEGFPPLKIKGRKLQGGEIEVDASVSSQFLSALLMIAPVMEQGLKIKLKGEPVSRPYIVMTLRMMEAAGVTTDFCGDEIAVGPQHYRPLSISIEGDWSAAAPWYQIEAMSSGAVSIANLAKESCQGDRVLADIYSRLGVDTDWEGEEGRTDLLANPDQDARLTLDFTPMPDLVPSVTVTCAMLGIPFRFTGLSTLRVKECDRVQALVDELAKTGTVIDIEATDVMVWEGRRVPITEMPRFATHDDHRMAMALAPVALYIPGIVIEDAEVVTKSYPGFWDDLRAAGFTLLDGDAPMSQPEENED